MTKIVELLDSLPGTGKVTPEECTIYRLSFEGTEKVYVGSSIRPKIRYAQHLKALKVGEHHSVKLKRHYNKHKKDPIHEVLEVCKTSDRQVREEHWIKTFDSLNKGFNMVQAEGVLTREELMKLREEKERVFYLNTRDSLLKNKDFSDAYSRLLAVVKDIGNEVRPDVSRFSINLFDRAGYARNASVKNLIESMGMGIGLLEKAVSTLKETPVDTSLERVLYVKAAWNGSEVLSNQRKSQDLNTKTAYELLIGAIDESNRYNHMSVLEQMLEEDYKNNS
jgi:hypothetical protein